MRPRSHDDEGAVAILYSVALLMMMGLLALTIDIGALRYDRAQSQTAADMAAVAGALDLMAVADGSPQEACQSAWDYFLINSGQSPSPLAGCTTVFPPTTSPCPAASLGPVIGTFEDHEVRIWWPVPDDSPLLDGRYDVTTDGADPCERIAVHISRTRGFIFGATVGQTEGSTGAPAVARAIVGEASEDVASLLLLDKVGCTALDASGGGQLRVTARNRAVATDPPDWAIGRIHVDSDGSACSGGQTTIRADGGGSILAYGDDADPPAPGEIRLFALPPGAASCTVNPRACRQSDVLTSPPPGYLTLGESQPAGIWPQPTGVPKRTNRTPADHQFNCRSDYADLDGQAPGPSDWSVPACTEGRPAYIDELRTAFGNGSTTPSGFRRWTEVFGPKACNVSQAVVPVGENLAALTGNWHVDCRGPGGFSLSGGQTVNFLNGNVVFQGPINNTGGELGFNVLNTSSLPSTCETALCPTVSSTGSAIVFIANGDLNQSGTGGGFLHINNAVVVMRQGVANLTGTGGYSWVAPVEGPFEKLAFWTDAPAGKHPYVNKFAGGGATTMRGVYFSPNALTHIAGGAGSVPKRAQFFTWRLAVVGGGSVVMDPDPDVMLPVPMFKGVLLIR